MACSDPSGYVEPVAFYNENDPFAAAWLRELIKANLIAPGVVDERSIEDIKPDELAQYTQCHFFAGIGGWSLALRLAGWPDDKPVWTGSCPCQPFSTAGKRTGSNDERHLWPAFFHLIEQCKPSVVFGEQVEAAIRQGWLDLVQDDMEGIGYAFTAAGIPAASVGAPHLRARLYFVADSERNAAEQRRIAIKSIEGDGTSSTRSSVESRRCSLPDAGTLDDTDDTDDTRSQGRLLSGDSADQRLVGPSSLANFWTECDWLYCRDEKYRPVESILKSMVDGLPESMGRIGEASAEAIEEEILAYATTREIDATKAMLDLQQTLVEKTLQRPSGRFSSVYEAPILLSFLRQLTQQGRLISKRFSSSCSETLEERMRSLRVYEEASRAPRKRELEGLSEKEHSNIMCVLSSVLARYASTAWTEAFSANEKDTFPLAHGEVNRIGRLRGYGNAIVAPLAQAFIESYLDTRLAGA